MKRLLYGTHIASEDITVVWCDTLDDGSENTTTEIIVERDKRSANPWYFDHLVSTEIISWYHGELSAEYISMYSDYDLIAYYRD